MQQTQKNLWLMWGAGKSFWLLHVFMVIWTTVPSGGDKDSSESMRWKMIIEAENKLY